MGLLTKVQQADTADRIAADVDAYKAQQAEAVAALRERINDRQQVVETRLAALEAEQADLARIQV